MRTSYFNWNRKAGWKNPFKEEDGFFIKCWFWGVHEISGCAADNKSYASETQDRELTGDRDFGACEHISCH